MTLSDFPLPPLLPPPPFACQAGGTSEQWWFAVKLCSFSNLILKRHRDRTCLQLLKAAESFPRIGASYVSEGCLTLFSPWNPLQSCKRRREDDTDYRQSSFSDHFRDCQLVREVKWSLSETSTVLMILFQVFALLYRPAKAISVRIGRKVTFPSPSESLKEGYLVTVGTNPFFLCT